MKILKVWVCRRGAEYFNVMQENPELYIKLTNEWYLDKEYCAPSYRIRNHTALCYVPPDWHNVAQSWLEMQVPNNIYNQYLKYVALYAFAVSEK